MTALSVCTVVGNRCYLIKDFIAVLNELLIMKDSRRM